MKERKIKIEVIKSTILNYVVNEIESKLESKNVENKKIKEFINLTKNEINSLLNSLDDDILLPKGKIKSKEDFQNHVLKIINIIRPKLMEKIERIEIER